MTSALPAHPRGDRRATARGDRSLHARYRRTRDPATREAIVERYLGLAAHVAARYERTSVPYDDRMQIACLGLLKAIDRFDVDRGAAFSSFAVPTMLGELRRHFRDHTWTVRPPRDLQDRVGHVERATEALTGELGRSPTPRDVGRALDLTVDQVLEAVEAGRARSGASLDEPATLDDDTPVAATIGHEDPGYERVEQAFVAERLLAELTPHQERILRLRFDDDLTQSAIAARVGCSQMTVSRVIREALDALSAAAGPAAAD